MNIIKLVINIEEETFEELIKYDKPVPSGNRLYDSILESVFNGAPLPEHHGRLIILSESKMKENQIHLDFSSQNWISEVGLSNATVAIIESNKEE